MKKQSGFTLIELMVVMAIIAILATAGLSAYTGYLKKSRDSVRIADIAAINTIVLAAMSSTGLVPADVAALKTEISNANNGTTIVDPLTVGTTAKSACVGYNSGADTTNQPCNYMYKSCSSNTEYMIAARFESLSNKTLLSGDSAGTNGTDTTHQTSLVLPVTITGGKQLYEVGTCTSTPTYAIATPASNDILDDN